MGVPVNTVTPPAGEKEHDVAQTRSQGCVYRAGVWCGVVGWGGVGWGGVGWGGVGWGGVGWGGGVGGA